MAYPIFGGPLVPTQLKGLWSEVEAGHLTKQEFADRQEVLISQYVEIWSDALRLPGESDLTRSLCLELADLTGCADLEVVKARCLDAVNAMRDEWHEVVSEEDETTIEEYYDKSRNYAYELMWWHTLEEDRSPKWLPLLFGFWSGDRFGGPAVFPTWGCCHACGYQLDALGFQPAPPCWPGY